MLLVIAAVALSSPRSSKTCRGRAGSVADRRLSRYQPKAMIRTSATNDQHACVWQAHDQNSDSDQVPARDRRAVLNAAWLPRLLEVEQALALSGGAVSNHASGARRESVTPFPKDAVAGPGCGAGHPHQRQYEEEDRARCAAKGSSRQEGRSWCNARNACRGSLDRARATRGLPEALLGILPAASAPRPNVRFFVPDHHCAEAR